MSLPGSAASIPDRVAGTGVRVIWTGDHLDAVRRLQGTLVQPARAALTGEGRGPLATLLARATRDHRRGSPDALEIQN
ncbi:MAG TPA: hypothetical protein VKR21_04260 [Solirubrobacteraceae bacterium]|nr:hypothetical protein [Solirubrobacteraceae bacterium]